MRRDPCQSHFGERHPCTRRIGAGHWRDSEVGNSQSLVNEMTRSAWVCDGSCQNTIVIGGQIEIIHCPCQIEIRVRVETLDE